MTEEARGATGKEQQAGGINIRGCPHKGEHENIRECTQSATTPRVLYEVDKRYNKKGEGQHKTTTELDCEEQRADTFYFTNYNTSSNDASRARVC